MSNETRLVLADDHPLFREGVAQTLRSQDDLEVVGEAASADDAVALVCDLLPDIVMLDLNMPGGGLAAAERIARLCPVTKIVVLTVSEDDQDVVTALRLGARGYILKGVSGSELIHIVRSVAGGESYVPPDLAANLLAEMTGRKAVVAPAGNPLDLLTEREVQILEGIAAGLSNKEVGLRLFLTEKTVKHYVTNILQKLQVRNRVEAALVAERSGLPLRPRDA